MKPKQRRSVGSLDKVKSSVKRVSDANEKTQVSARGSDTSIVQLQQLVAIQSVDQDQSDRDPVNLLFPSDDAGSTCASAGEGLALDNCADDRSDADSDWAPGSEGIKTMFRDCPSQWLLDKRNTQKILKRNLQSHGGSPQAGWQHRRVHASVVSLEGPYQCGTKRRNEPHENWF